LCKGARERTPVKAGNSLPAKFDIAGIDAGTSAINATIYGISAAV
jgi:hypothetical protein